MNYVWSRWARNAVEHVAREGEIQPICGRYLSPENVVLRSQPSGLAPVCERCQKKLVKEAG